MAGALRSVHKPTTPAKFLTQSSWPGTVALDVKCVVPFVQDITKKERGVGGQDDSGEEDSSAQVREVDFHPGFDFPAVCGVSIEFHGHSKDTGELSQD